MVSATVIGDLPEELLLQILALLSVQELLGAARRVCRSWQVLVAAPALWRRRCLEVTDDVDDLTLLRLTHAAPYLGKLVLRRPLAQDVLEAVARHCRRLSSLEVFCCWVPGAALLEVFSRRCPSLRHLGLPASVLGDAGAAPLWWSSMPALRSVRVTVETPGARLELPSADGTSGSRQPPPRLEALRLEMSRCRAAPLDALLRARGAALRALSLTLFPGERPPPALSECPGLRELVLYCPPRTPPPDLLGVLHSHLRVLHLEGPEYSRSEIAVGDCDDAALWTLFEFGGGGGSDDDVDEGRLKHRPLVDDAFLRALCSACPLLQDLVLGLRGRTLLTAAGLGALRGLPRLRKLGLRFCPPPLTAAAVLDAAPRGLTHLDLTALCDLRGRPRWTDLPLLSALVLDCCDVGDLWLPDLQALGALRTLSLEFCEGVDAEAVARLQRAVPGLSVVYDETL